MRSRSPAAIDAFVDYARVAAAALLDANIGVVLSLARELLTHRTLDATESRRSSRTQIAVALPQRQ